MSSIRYLVRKTGNKKPKDHKMYLTTAEFKNITHKPKFL